MIQRKPFLHDRSLTPPNRFVVATLFLAWGSPGFCEPPKSVEVRLTFTETVSKFPFTGRVFVVASKEPINGGFRQSWFKPQPFFSQDVRGWKPGTQLAFQPQFHFPMTWLNLRSATYYFQAIMDMDQGGQNPLTSPGNGYSKPLKVELDAGHSGVIALVIEQTIARRKFVETDRVKLVDIESRLLSAFHGKPIRLRAGVVLPKEYPQEPSRRYPVVYEIPGFGGNHHMAFAVAARELPDTGVAMIHVVLDPACRLGHHVFADSANNGPCGRALIDELIPAIERKYRTLNVPSARFVTGHSSGGWSSLWLQTTYPDFFGGVWSTAPDSVDFRDFQKVNIYAKNANLFVDDKGQPRPFARKAGKVVLTYKTLSDIETVMGRGGQLWSFEAVFSPKGTDGTPRRLWDRTTGDVDPQVAAAWQTYDIRLGLQTRWAKLEPKLAGKIHVYMGSEDTFYLEGATLLLQKALTKLHSDAVVEIFSGRDHGTLIDQKLRDRITREMAAQFRKNALP